MIKKIILAVAFLISTSSAGTISLAVAANVSYAMPSLQKAFNKHYPDTKLQTTLTSSGKLTAQIKNGAPYDLFMSANMKYPEALYSEKIAITKPVIYAQGALAMLTIKELDLSQGIELVTKKDVEKVAIANPKTAPYGTAAKAAFEKAGVYKSVEPKLVYAESITQTVQYALTAADIGFIAKSTLYSDKMTQYKEGVNWVDVDPKLYKPIEQGIVILKNAEGNKEAKAFYDFMLSPEAKSIMKEYGYIVE
jgi:molybdate transport system substrate-binding protein